MPIQRYGHQLRPWVSEAKRRGEVLETIRAHPDTWLEGGDVSLLIGLPRNRGEIVCSKLHRWGLLDRIGRGRQSDPFRYRARPGALASWEHAPDHPTQYQTLWALVRDNPGLTYRDYARMFDIESNHMAALLSSLFKRGHLDRKGRGGSIEGRHKRDANTYRYFAKLDNPPPGYRHV